MDTPTAASCTMCSHHAKLGEKIAQLYGVLAELPLENNLAILSSLIGDLHHYAQEKNLNWEQILNIAQEEYDFAVDKDAEFRRGANAARMDG